MTGGCGIIHPVPTDLTIVYVMTHTAVLVIQYGKDGETALDRARVGKRIFPSDDQFDKIIQYLEAAVGK